MYNVSKMLSHTVSSNIMAKYATTEKTYICKQCDTRLTIREAKRRLLAIHTLLYSCPCCNDTIGWIDPADEASDVFRGADISRRS